MRKLKLLAGTLLLAICLPIFAQTTERVIDIPTRAGVTQRMLLLTPADPKAVVILFAGGHGGLQIFANGSMKWGDANFLIRTRQLFADAGFVVAVVDAPSDRLLPPFLKGFRQKPEHAEDIKAVIVWLRAAARLPVWLIGTSAGTQSVGYVATKLDGAEGPDGIVLTSTILSDDKVRPVPDMPLGKIRVPVLVVHHEHDACAKCAFAGVPALMNKLGDTTRHQLLSFTGGVSTGDPCEALAYHGFNGIESEVVQQIAAWILAK